MTLLSWIEFCKNQHDVVCNQKYDRTLPYSFHLSLVFKNAQRFIELLVRDGDKSFQINDRTEAVYMAAWGHDLIEDARLSYNDIQSQIGVSAAEIIFLCTEMRGRDRAERKNGQFYDDLMKNESAVFVKLCDIMANSMYSTMTGSTMLKKQKDEWNGGIRIKVLQWHPQFGKMVDYLDKIYAL